MKAVRPVLTWILIASGTLSAAQTTQVVTPQSNSSPTSRHLRSQLRQSQLTPLENPTEAVESRKSLKDLSEELRRLQLPQLQTPNTASPKSGPSTVATQSPATPGPVSPENPQPAATNSPTISAKQLSDSPAQSISVTPKVGSPKSAIADPVLGILTANPQAVIDLFSAAEALFAMRDLPRAAALYKQVTSQMTDNLQDQNRSWALFQYGNCLRFTKSVEAAALYNKVIADYPESDWAKVARIRNQYITWAQQAKPETILIRYGYDPNSF